MSLPDWPHFRMVQEADVDGVLRLTLLGELDMAGVDQLILPLQRWRRAGVRVRIDLSELAFIDVRGFTAIRDAVRAGRSSGGALVELDPNLSRPVQRLFDLLGVSPELVPAAEADRHGRAEAG